MSVNAFAKRVGLNQKTLDQTLKGERKPSLQIVMAICQTCGVSADWLLGLDNHRPPEARGGTPAAPCPECAKKDAAIARLERVIDKLTK